MQEPNWRTGGLYRNGRNLLSWAETLPRCFNAWPHRIHRLVPLQLAAEVSSSADEADITCEDESDQDTADKVEDNGSIQDFGNKSVRSWRKVARETEESGGDVKRKHSGAREGVTEVPDLS